MVADIWWIYGTLFFVGVEIVGWEVLIENKISVYVLKSNTSGQTQPLCLEDFSAVQNEPKTAMQDCALYHNYNPLHVFDIFALLLVLCQQGLNPANTLVGFDHAFIWPFKPLTILFKHRPASSICHAPDMSNDEFMKCFEDRNIELQN